MTQTPITQRGIDWAQAIVDGRQIANKRILQACEKFFADLERQDTADFPYVFSPDHAEHMCEFLECLPQVEGEWADRNEALALMGYQAFGIGQINGWRHVEKGTRRYKTSYWEVPRKNGKSTLLSGSALYFFVPDGEPGAKVFTAASSTEQARIVFDTARAMALGMYNSTRVADLLNINVKEHWIKSHSDVAAIMKPVAAQTKSQDGKNPHFASLDELHEHAKRDVWDSMINAMGSRSHPLLFAITTAGHNTSGICFEQRRYVEKLLDGILVDESYFGLIFEADEGDEPGDEKVWAKVNPGLGVSKSIDFMREQWAKANASPAAMGEFLRKHLNIWTSIGESAIDLQKVMGAEDPGMNISDYSTVQNFVGVDLAIRDDIASVVNVAVDGNKFRCFSWHFLPEAALHKPGNEHLLGWAQEGYLHYTPGSELDLNIVEALVNQLHGVPHDFDIWSDVPVINPEMVIYDPHFAAQMAANWDRTGINAVELRQGARNHNVPFHLLIAAADDGRLICDGNPVMRWMIGNTKMKRVPGGDFIFPTKDAPEEKIDGVTALLNALWPVKQAEEEDNTPSYSFLKQPVMSA